MAFRAGGSVTGRPKAYAERFDILILKIKYFKIGMKDILHTHDCSRLDACLHCHCPSYVEHLFTHPELEMPRD